MKNLVCFCAVLCTWLLSEGSLRASKPAVPEEPKGLSLRIVSTNLSPGMKIPEWAVLGIQGEVVPLQVVSWNVSAPVLMQKGDQISIYDKEDLLNAVQSKTALPKPVVSEAYPSGAVKCLMVLKPVKKGSETGWEGQVFDESVKGYPGGSRLFLNLTPYQLSGLCGKVAFDIPAHGATLVDPKVKSDDFREIVQVFASLQTRKATVLDEVWAFLPNSRGIALVFEAEKTIRLVTIPDEVPEDLRPAAGS